MLARKGFPVLLAAIGAVFTLVIERSTHFHADDFGHFLKLGDRSFVEFALTPIDVHLVPLHRTFSFLIFMSFPLDFRVGLAVLLAFHAGAVALLSRTLRLLHDGPLNHVLVFVYATHVFFFVPLSWWSSGIHRFPYIFLAIACIHLYLRCRKTLSVASLLGAAACFVVALGFYIKAALIPAYLIGLELCLLREVARPQRLRNVAVLAGFCAVSAAYLLATSAAVSERFAFVHIDWSTVFLAEAYSLTMLGGAVLALAQPGTLGKLASGAVWSLFFLYTVVKRPLNLFVWLVGLGLIALNVFAIGISNRTLFGPEIVYSQRYYFELMFLVVIFIALMLRDLPAPALSARLASRPAARARVRVLFVLLAMGYASLSCLQGVTSLRENRNDAMVKEFMDNLTAGIARLRADPPKDLSFVDGRVPKHVHWVGAFRSQPYSRFLQMFDIEATFDDRRSQNLYRITDQGEVVRVKRRARPR
jgi:hypothetical protein